MAKKDEAWIKKAKTSELLEYYNKKTNSKVKKFATRVDAERRCLEAMAKKQTPYSIRRNSHGYTFNGQVYDRIIHMPKPEALRCAKMGTKVDILIGLLKTGATMDEVIAVLSTKGRSVTVAGARNWFNWPLNALHGYGVGILDGKLVLIYPKGISAPLPNQFNEEARALLEKVRMINKL